MSIIAKIKEMVWDYNFRRKLSGVKREREFMNLQNARTVIVLFKVTDEMSYYKINSFVKTLQKNQAIVNALGFVEGHLIPSFCAQKLSFDFITSKDLNWYQRPTRPFVEDMIKKECDMLFDFCMEDVLPLQYIAGLSRAKQIVGRFSEKNKDFYDIMIDTTGMDNVDDFIKQVVHYTTLINN